MKIEGQCHCGAIAYEAEVEPGSMTVCHCNDCQIHSGSAFRANIPAPAISSARATGNAPCPYPLALTTAITSGPLTRPPTWDTTAAPTISPTVGLRRSSGRQR